MTFVKEILAFHLYANNKDFLINSTRMFVFLVQCLLNPFSLISPDVCHNVEFSECQGLYRYTTLPSLNQTELAPRFQAFFGDVLSSNCSLKALQFFCASMFTICDPKNGSVVSPCRQLCEGEDALCYTCSGWLNL